MPALLTPGVSFERSRAVEAAASQRTDVAGFVGIAERGPLHAPRRVTAWREFEAAFGGRLPYAHLAWAVHGFFANGGRACWVVRVADARTAAAGRTALPAAEADEPAYRVVALEPGRWGNELSVAVAACHLGATLQDMDVSGLPPARVAVTNLAGFEAGSLVRLTPAGGGPPERRRVEAVDVVRGVLVLDSPLSAPGPVGVESVEFTLTVLRDGQVVERHPYLAPDSQHSRDAARVVAADSGLIRLERSGAGVPRLPWTGSLTGGFDGLAAMTVYDHVGSPGGRFGLAQLAEVDEVSILVLPDLMLGRAPRRELRRAARPQPDPCGDRTEAARALAGTVVDGQTGAPLAAVTVSDQLTRTLSDSDGTFELTGFMPGARVDLTFSRSGYEDAAVPVAVALTGAGPQSLGAIALDPIDQPPVLGREDIAFAQAAMVAQCERLRDRFAVLDPPPFVGSAGEAAADARAWRDRFDTSFAALYFPWVVVPGGRAVPPCGHVAGVYAATDTREGVFRPPANRRLEGVLDLTAAVDDARQALLNPVGVNVIRAFPGRGTRVYGARTTSSQPAWRHVNVRRFLAAVEETIVDGLQWAVFEPADDALRAAVRLWLIGLLDRFWRQGALVGEVAEQAYTVRCDGITTSPDDAAVGRLIAEVGVAPVRPYEFVVLRLGTTQDELQLVEA